MHVLDDFREHGHLLTSSKLEMVVHGSHVTGHTTPQTDRSSRWATLKIYLVRIFYKLIMCWSLIDLILICVFISLSFSFSFYVSSGSGLAVLN